MIRTFYDPVYGRQVFVAVGEPDEKVARRIERAGFTVDDEFREKMKMGDGTNGKFTCELDTPLTLIRFKRLRVGDPVDVAVLAHEAAHAAVALFEILKQPIGSDTDEPFAYYVGFIVRSTLNAVKGGR